MRRLNTSTSRAVRSTREKLATPKTVVMRAMSSARGTAFLNVSSRRAGKLRISFVPRSLTAASTLCFNISVK